MANKHKCDRLWKVDYKNKGVSASEHLWIIAFSVSIAEKKAKKFLKRYKYGRCRVTGVESHGTIDVF